MKLSCSKPHLLFTTAIVGLAIGGPAFAQGTTAQGTAAEETTVVEDGVRTDTDANVIIVTGQRGAAARLEDVPAAIIAVSGEELETAGVRRFQDLAVIAPGVQISRSGTFTQPSIRGVSTTFAGGGQETNVAIYVDGFYTSDQLSTNQDFANIESVEVLKGPQGTLYGRNATGGAILINTKKPGDKFEADFLASYAWRYNDRIVQGFVASPLGDGIALSIAGYYRENDGYFKDINSFAPSVALDATNYTFGGKTKRTINEAAILDRSGNNDVARFKNWSIRPKLLIEPTDGVEIILGYVHNFVNDPRAFAYGATGQLLNKAPLYNGFPTALNLRDRTSLNFRPTNRSQSDEFNGTVRFELGDGHVLTSRTAYRTQDDFQTFDLDGTAADSGLPNVPAAVGTTYIGIQFNERQTMTQQLDYEGQFGPLTLLSGLFYYDDKFLTPGGIEDLGLSSTPTATFLRFETEAWAAYLDATYNISDKLFVTLGGRYSHDEKKLGRERVTNDGTFIPSQGTICYTDVPDPIFNAACTNEFFKETSANAFTPRAVVRYSLSPGTNVYASYSRGFKAPTINTAAPFNSLRAEKVTSYELGFKTARDGFRGEVSGFYYDYTDAQISAINANSPAITTLIQNSGGAEIYGVDLTLSYRFPDFPLNIRGGFAYLHARYTDFDNATNVTVTPGDTNTSVTSPWTGRRIVRAPDWSGSVSFDYTADVAGGALMLSATGSFSSRYAPQNASYLCTRVARNAAGQDIPFTPGAPGFCATGTDTLQNGRFEENGYFLANAQLSWTDPNEHFTATLFSDNITNTRYKIISTGFAYHSYDQFNEPRTVGVRLRYKY